MRKGREKSALVLTLLMLAGTSPVSGAPGVSGPAVKEAAPESISVKPGAGSLQANLDSKMRLVKLLLDESPAVQRIPHSGNAQAKNMLADAQAAYARAGIEAQGGRLDASVKLLDDALRQIVAASRLVPDPTQLAALERARYSQLSEAIRTFQMLYKNTAERSAKSPQISASAVDLERIGSMAGQAAVLAAAGKHHDANMLLDNAYKIVVSMLNKMLASQTIVYNTKFDAPTDEYQHELARNSSYEELIPIALAELHTPVETAALSEGYMQQSRQLREVAQQQAASGDHRAAVKTMQEATAQLERALRTSGLVVPQAAELRP